MFLKSPFLKSPFSDEIEIESSLTRLDINDKFDIWEKLVPFFKTNKYDLNSWRWTYPHLANKNKVPSNDGRKSENKISALYNKFNSFLATQRLYHEIKKDVGEFEEKINPFELLIPKIVKPRIIDNRIKNQQSLFMFVPFLYFFKKLPISIFLDYDKIKVASKILCK